MKLGNNIQAVDYTYNVRDWLKYINNINSMGTDKFAMTLGYDTVGTNPRYNGNIASSSSLISGQSAYAYNYVYDKANRLVDANYTNNNLFSEKTISYDANGNILSLTRHMNSSTGTVLNYSYDATRPNRLNSNSGLITATYSYDGNGSILKDGRNNFLYDYRNMPIRDTIVSTSTIRWFAYDQGGQRIKYLRVNTSGVVQDSSRIYVLAGGKIAAEYIRLSGSWNNVDHYNIYGNDLIGKLQGTSRFYYLKDHLGSTRVVVKDSSGTAVVDSWTDYYAFGKISRSSETANSPKEKFTGKEYDAESDLNYFGARYYNANIGRWMSVDPKHEYQSPYVYVGNNPVGLIDPTGLESEYLYTGPIWNFSQVGKEKAERWSYFMRLGLDPGDGDDGDKHERKQIGKVVIKSTDSKTLSLIDVKASSDIIKSYGKDNPMMKDGIINLGELKATLETFRAPSIEDPGYAKYAIAKEIAADLGFFSKNGKATFNVYSDSRIWSSGAAINVFTYPPYDDVTKFSRGVIYFNEHQENQFERIIKNIFDKPLPSKKGGTSVKG